jgi:hypothetical protein
MHFEVRAAATRLRFRVRVRSSPDCSARLCSKKPAVAGFLALLLEQGRQDSNLQPPVLEVCVSLRETGANPRFQAVQVRSDSLRSAQVGSKSGSKFSEA